MGLSPSHLAHGRQCPPRFWPTAVIYTVGALAGALWGGTVYLINPVVIIGRLSFSDLRHAGAIVGAVCGAALGALLRGWTRRVGAGFLAPFLFFPALAGLVYLLCAHGEILGAITMVTLASPWVLTLGRRMLLRKEHEPETTLK